jgi:hypothetical protein
MVTIKREVPVEEAPAQQPRSENSNDPAAGPAPPPHPALAKDPRQENYEFVFQAFLLNQKQDYATASEEWRQQYHLHRQLAERLQKSIDLDREEAWRNPQRMSDRQMQLMLLEAQNRQRLEAKLKKAREEGHDCTPVRVYESLPLCDYYELQLMHLEANDKRRLQEKARDEHPPVLANDVGSRQTMSDYYQQQLLALEAQNKRRLQERARNEGADTSAVANEVRKRSVEGMRIPLRPKPAEILSGPTATQLEALVQKAGHDQWRIEPPVPRFEPDFSKMDREAISKHHQEMVAQEATMRQQLLRAPLNLTLPEHRDARHDYATEFQRLEKMNNLRLPTYYSVQAHIQRNQDLASIEADPDFQRWKQQRQNEIRSSPESQTRMSEVSYQSPIQQPQTLRRPQEYQIQLMLLEQQRVKRLETARQEQVNGQGSMSGSYNLSPDQKPQTPLQKYILQCRLLEQHGGMRGGKRIEMVRQEQDNMIPVTAEPSTITSPIQNPASTPPQVKQERDLEAEFHGFFPQRPVPTPTWNPPHRSTSHLVDYDKQVKMLEQQNKNRLARMKKKQERMDVAIKTEEPSESSQLHRLEMHNRKRPAMARDEQELKATESPAPEIDTSWPSEPKAGTHVLSGYQRALAQLEQQGGKRLKIDRTPSRAIHGLLPNRDPPSFLPDVAPQTEVIYKAQVQQTGWAEGLTETETDRETAISCFSPTPEATPEVEKMDMTDVNIYDLEESPAPALAQRSHEERLTEAEWLKAVDDDEDSPEAFAARKQARKERREKTKLKILALTPESTERSSNNSRLPTINEQVARPDDDMRPLVIRENCHRTFSGGAFD